MNKLNWYRVEVRVPGMAEPMVDWYDAETLEQARALHDEDAHRYCLPMDKIQVAIRLATAQESKAFVS